jgi:hypothetical protein
MGRLPGAAAQRALFWYTAGIADIGPMLVVAKAEDEEEVA